MSKNKLNISLSFDFSLMGLISALKEYQLAWRLNNALEIRLIKEEDILLEFISGKDLLVSNYVYATETSQLRLLKNKTVSSSPGESNAFLLPELNRFDYLIIIEGFEDTFDTKMLKEKIQAIKHIEYLQFFDPNELKSRENLIF